MPFHCWKIDSFIGLPSFRPFTLTLDRELLIKLIDKIIVGQKTTVDGVERQDITIVYNLVGQVD